MRFTAILPATAALLGAAPIGAALWGAGPAEAGGYRPTLPHASELRLVCEVAADSTTRNCALASPIDHTAADKATLRDVDAHPEYLAGATPGTTVKVLIRRGPAPGDQAAPVGTIFVGPDAAAAPAHGAPPDFVTDPDWRIFPRRSELNLYFPERAQRMSVSGDAAITCSVRATGELVGCWVSSEAPPGFGFGEALLKLGAMLQMKALSSSGSPVAGRPVKLEAGFVTNRDGAYGIRLSVVTE